MTTAQQASVAGENYVVEPREQLTLADLVVRAYRKLSVEEVWNRYAKTDAEDLAGLPTRDDR